MPNKGLLKEKKEKECPAEYLRDATEEQLRKNLEDFAVLQKVYFCRAKSQRPRITEKYRKRHLPHRELKDVIWLTKCNATGLFHQLLNHLCRVEMKKRPHKRYEQRNWTPKKVIDRVVERARKEFGRKLPANCAPAPRTVSDHIDMHQISLARVTAKDETQAELDEADKSLTQEEKDKRLDTRDSYTNYIFY